MGNSMKKKGKSQSTEFKKLEKIGAIIGEDCNIGSNVVVEPGKIIGRRCKIAPMKRIIENVPSNNKVM